MEKNWVKVYSSPLLFKVSVIKGMLEEHEIDAIEINKQDTAYTTFGEIELYVKQDQVIRALYLIEKMNF